MKYKGLSSSQVNKLQPQYGLNVLPAEKARPAWRIFFSQFANPLVYLVCFAGIISFFLHKFLDFVFVFSVVLINAIFGFVQEYKAQKTLLALKKLVKPTAKTLRDGQRQEIEATQLVPGDLVFLAAGDKVPADGVVLESAEALLNEAILTGESEAVSKSLTDEVFMGTTVVSGRLVISITKTGSATKIGEIAETLKETIQPLTTLQLRLKKFTRKLIFISLFLSLCVFILGLLAGQEVLSMMQMAAVLLVAVIPEALLVVVTLILVVTMQKTLKRGALVRNLLAIETLGSVTTICTDKTGTLTEGKMTVAKTDFANRYQTLLALCLCNDLSDNVEVAVWDYLKNQKDFDVNRVTEKYQRIFEIPFSSEYKFMVTANCPEPGTKEDCVLLVKGAPEIILAMSSLSQVEKDIYLKKIDGWAKKGLKVLGLASRKISKDEIDQLGVKTMPKLEWGGIVGLWDPPRKEAKEALLVAKKAGIKVRVVTGDYRLTAEKIMEFLGMNPLPHQVIEVAELDKMSNEVLKNKIADVLLFTRVTPQQKLRLVKILQEMGEVVAMTGDGVNDAPALKKSNIGIVVGEASEVAKEAADIVLLDSNFKTLTLAIEEGRVVFDNIKKVITFLLSDSFAEVVLMMGAIVLGLPLPLTIVQILWIHLLCDGPEDIVLGFEPKEREVMLEKPKRIDEPIVNRFGIFLIILVSLLSGGYALFLFWYFGFRLQDLQLGRTLAFMALSFDSIFYIFSCRSFRKPLWRSENFWKNKWLFATVIFSLTFLVLVTYIPFTQNLLDLVPLSFKHWLLLLVIAIVIILIIEVVKGLSAISLLRDTQTETLLGHPD